MSESGTGESSRLEGFSVAVFPYAAMLHSGKDVPGRVCAIIMETHSMRIDVPARAIVRAALVETCRLGV
jgi:hypothetical protein